MTNSEGLDLIENISEYHEKLCDIFSTDDNAELGVQLLEAVGVPEDKIFFLSLFFSHNDHIQKVNNVISKLKKIIDER